MQGRLVYRVLDDEGGTGAEAEGTPRDICINGIGFVAREALEEGALLQLALEPSLAELGRLEREGVVVGRETLEAGGCHMACRFTTGEETDVVRIMLHLYQSSGQHHRPPLSQLAWMCGAEDLERWPFFGEGKECWETDQAPCGPHALDDCAACPYAALAFLIWGDTQQQGTEGEAAAERERTADSRGGDKE